MDFFGYHRTDGQVGVRNHLLVLSVGGLTGPAARRIAGALQGAKCVVIPYEVGLVGEDKAAHDRCALGLAVNPNVGATLLLGDNPQSLEALEQQLATRGRDHVALSLDDCGNDIYAMTERAFRLGAALIRQASRARRAPAPLSALTIGLECGRSDPSSGLVANPLPGQIADRVADAGGRVILGETLEWLGAEHLLAGRAATPEVADNIVTAVRRRETAAIEAGVDLLGTNPTPTNIHAGLSTIEEKSLGSTAKSGSRRIEGLIRYGETPPGSGLWVMDAAAYAPESLTGYVASGAQLTLFTTGVGNSYVSLLAPTVKVCANPANCARLGGQIDFDASKAFTGEISIEALAETLAGTLCDIASGSATWGEILGEGDEVVSRYGAAL